MGTVLSAVARSTRQGEYQYRAIRCGRVYIGTVLSAVVHTRTPPLMFRTANGPVHASQFSRIKWI